MSDLSIPDPAGRRRFLATVGLAGLAAGLRVGSAQAQTATPAPATPAPAAPAGPATPTEPSEDARALAAIVQRRYGAHLGPDDLKEITEELDYRLQSGKRLRSAPLVNSDEPDTTFRP